MQSLSVGAKIWGSIAEIHPKELIVSLPHGLRGRVQYSEVLLFLLMPISDARAGACPAFLAAWATDMPAQVHNYACTLLPKKAGPREALAQNTC